MKEDNKELLIKKQKQKAKKDSKEFRWLGKI